MAKYNPNKSNKKVAKPVYPSQFGSHESMVNAEYPEFNYSESKWVVCTDDRGNYVTEKKNLDSGLCDFNRSVNIELREAKFNEMVKGEKDGV